MNKQTEALKLALNAKDLTEIPPSCFEGAIWADAKLKEKNA